jgi:hypothetical protein
MRPGIDFLFSISGAAFPICRLQNLLETLISSYFWRWRFVHLSRNSRQNFKLWTTSQDYAVVARYVKSNKGF